MTLITSPANPRISKLKDLHTARGRKKSGLFPMEGPNLLEALFAAHVVPHEVYYQPAYLQRTTKGKVLLERLLHNTSGLGDEQRIEVNERVIEAVSDTVTSQGVISVLPLAAFQEEQTRARRTQHVSATQEVQRPALLILDDIADPGNMGTILRTALATDVDTVVLTPNCVDCYSPKVVRAAAGAHLLLPIISDASWQTIAESIQTHGSTRVLLAEARSTTLYYEQDLTHPFALIIGNEAHGPSSEAHALATTSITIPLANGVESLNAAMATGIVLYEAVRQRQQRS